MAIAFLTSAQGKDDGFTLVEILCVLVILGLSAGVVLLNMPKGESRFSKDVHAFATTVNVAARDSVIDGQVRGVDIRADGFELFNYTQNWEGRGAQDWPDLRRVDVRINDQPIDLKARAKSDVPQRPLILLEPTGAVTDFTLDVQARDEAFVVKTNDRGRVIVQAGP